jgi:hypothetical protein
LTRTVFKTSVNSAEAEAYRRVAKGLRNPRRVRDVQLRIAFLTLSIMLSYPLVLAYVTFHMGVALLTEALVILTTVLLYVIACDPLPPCPGKVTEWLRGLLPTRSAGDVALGEAPVPPSRLGNSRAGSGSPKGLASSRTWRTIGASEGRHV